MRTAKGDKVRIEQDHGLEDLFAVVLEVDEDSGYVSVEFEDGTTAEVLDDECEVL